MKILSVTYASSPSSDLLIPTLEFNNEAAGGVGVGLWSDKTDLMLRTQLSRVCQFVTKNAGLTDFVSVKDHGAIGDGVEHPLSSQFSTLLAAQMVYPFATSLTQQIDWAGIQSAIFTGKPVWVPDGQYLSSDEIEQVSTGQVIQFSNTGGYGILGYDEWGDEYEPVMIEKEIPIFDENNNQTGVDIILVDSGEKVLTRKAGSRYNVNPTEALMLEAALMRRALNSIKVN